MPIPLTVLPALLPTEMFNFETATNPVSSVVTWPFAVLEPPALDPSELEFLSTMQFSPPPLNSPFYCLPITPECLHPSPLSSTPFPLILPSPSQPANPVSSVVTWPFALPEPPAPHSSELAFLSLMRPSPPPLNSPFYSLPITPECPCPSPPSSTSFSLILSSPSQQISTLVPVSTILSPPASPGIITAPLPNPFPNDTPSVHLDATVHSVHSSPPPTPYSFASPEMDTSSPLPYPFPLPDQSHFVHPTTHAARNPHLPLQTSRVHAKTSTLQKGMNAIKAKATKEKRALLSQAIQDLQEKHKKDFEALARTHLVTTDYINKLMEMPHFKPKRDISLQNAKVHTKSVEVNAGVSLPFHFSLIISLSCIEPTRSWSRRAHQVEGDTTVGQG